jgi:hypothetical protein
MGTGGERVEVSSAARGFFSQALKASANAGVSLKMAATMDKARLGKGEEQQGSRDFFITLSQAIVTGIELALTGADFEF